MLRGMNTVLGLSQRNGDLNKLSLNVGREYISLGVMGYERRYDT